VHPFRRPEQWFSKKLLIEGPDGEMRMYLKNPFMSFAQLASDDLLTTQDLQRLFNCTARTIYRWIAEEGLPPYAKLGRDYLFRKDQLVKWYRRTWQD
jgi:excisionase family DNA binding protein